MMLDFIQKRRRIKFIVSAVLAVNLLACLVSGCASGAAEQAAEDIALEEPVGIAANYDVASLRDLYDYQIYSSVVAPYVTEYSFDKDQRFKKYGAVPGETVAKGDPLVYSDTKELDHKIEELQETISDMEVDHDLEAQALQKDILDAKKTEYEVGQGYAEMYKFEPDPAWKDAHAGWEAIALGPEGAYRRSRQARERIEQSLKETNELYELEHQYKLDSLERLQGKEKDSTLMAKSDGVVVNCMEVYGGGYVSKDVSLLAVGDTSVKLLRTDYLSKGTVAKAEDLYAFINGERYEVTYEPMDQVEYNQRKQEGETIYSTFYLQDPENKLQMGQYAVLVLVKESRRDVVCIPSDAVKVEKDASYCYVYDGENSVYTPIETGMKDGLYVEVLSGIHVGDKVLSAQGVTMGKNKKTLEIGECATPYESNGFLYYPFSEWLVNPVDQGKTYIKEIFVTDYQSVAKDDVLLTLEVVSDDVEIARCNKKLERLAERLARLQKKKNENDGKKIIDRATERAINANMVETERVKRTLDKLTKYSGVYEVKAPADGLVMNARNMKVGDLINPETDLLQFADNSLSYIIVQDDKAVLSYGNEAQIEYVDENSKRQALNSTIVTVGNSSASKDLVKDWALVSIPEEAKELLAGSRENDLGAWSRNSFKVTVSTRAMDHVVLVPKSAVYMMGGSTYVNVVADDGTVSRKCFMAGGSNNSFYWAISGLSKGMNICWE